MGFAIISIMFFHYCENALSHYNSGIHWDITYLYNMFIGSIGVEIFLFLSGMGLFFSLKNNNDISRFYSRRLTKVLVPYIIYAPIAWFIIDITLQNLNISSLVYDLSMLSFWFDGTKTIWFIPFILMMYVAFPLVYNMIEKNKSSLNIIIIILTIFVLECFRQTNPSAYSNTSIALTRIPIFILGAYYGKKIYNKERMSNFTK